MSPAAENRQPTDGGAFLSKAWLDAHALRLTVETDIALRLEDLEKRVRLVSNLHHYGDTYNDDGDSIGKGCTECRDTWPCPTLIALGVNPPLAREYQAEKERDA